MFRQVLDSGFRRNDGVMQRSPKAGIHRVEGVSLTRTEQLRSVGLRYPLRVHPDPQPLVDTPLALVAHDPDVAHLRRIGDVRAPVGL